MRSCCTGAQDDLLFHMRKNLSRLYWLACGSCRVAVVSGFTLFPQQSPP